MPPGAYRQRRPRKTLFEGEIRAAGLRARVEACASRRQVRQWSNGKICSVPGKADRGRHSSDKVRTHSSKRSEHGSMRPDTGGPSEQWQGCQTAYGPRRALRTGGGVQNRAYGRTPPRAPAKEEPDDSRQTRDGIVPQGQQVG